MNSLSEQSNRDPVCGMSVDPAAAKHTYEYQGATWYFCADNCRQQFIANPSQYLAVDQDNLKTAPPRKISWSREVFVAAGVFAVVVTFVVVTRGFAKKDVSVQPGTRVTGVSAGQHQTIDGGQGGVIAEATHEQQASDLEFTVALNTHTVDLSDFNPTRQVRLAAGGREYAPQTILKTGDRSTHHQSYRLAFPPVDDRNVTVIVRGIGGIEERNLPFSL